MSVSGIIVEKSRVLQKLKVSLALKKKISQQQNLAKMDVLHHLKLQKSNTDLILLLQGSTFSSLSAQLQRSKKMSFCYSVQPD